jgi:hypothetical protein
MQEGSRERTQHPPDPEEIEIPDLIVQRHQDGVERHDDGEKQQREHQLGSAEAEPREPVRGDGADRQLKQRSGHAEKNGVRKSGPVMGALQRQLQGVPCRVLRYPDDREVQHLRGRSERDADHVEERVQYHK